MRNLLIWALLFTVVSCSRSKVPKDILPPEKMQAVYWDYLKVDVFVNDFVRRDSSKNLDIESARLQNQVFQLHKTNRKQFYSSYDYYLRNPGLMKPILDTMIKRRQDEAAVLDSLKSRQSPLPVSAE